MKQKYYFAYGSNMDQKQMKERCPDAELLGTASLRNYKLVFTIFSETRNCGCADIVPDYFSAVYGLFYRMTDPDFELLDEFEGVSKKAYRRISVTIEDGNGKLIEAETYEVVSKESEHQTPSEHYLSQILGPAQEFRFPLDYIKYLESFDPV